MKALITGGILVALGWLASSASAQEVPIKWQASTPKAAAPAVENPTPGLRPVTLMQPRPLGTAASEPFGPIIRGQAPDNKVAPVPKLEVIGPEPKTIQEPKTIKKLPKEGFPPEPQPVPSPIFGNIFPEGGILDACGITSCGRRLFHGDGLSQDRAGGCWVGAEYLMWWQKGQQLPPLVTGTPIGSTAPVGVLPGAAVLYDSIPDSVRGGGRFSFGWWCPHFCNNLGLEVDLFFLGRYTTNSVFDATSGLSLGRPFFSVINNGNNAEVFSAADRTGSASISTYTQLWGIEANVRYKWCSGSRWWLDGLIGYRHITLSEGIDIQENLAFNTTNRADPNFGTSFVERESFQTRNQFNGVNLGLAGECRLWDRWFLGVTSKLGLGVMHQTININGSTTRILNGGAPVTQQGALLATQTNIGSYTGNRFGVASEIGLKLGYDVTENLRVHVGYDFLYLNSVVRPGEQIDLRVNSELRPFTGNTVSNFPRVPAPLYNTNSFWAQGLNFGVSYRY